MIGTFDLAGKTALVTGASGGIGREIAVRLAEAGADLGLIARGVEGLEGTAALVANTGRSVEIAPADLSDESATHAAVDALIGALGGVDIVVNNAGGARFMAPMLDTAIAGWNKVLALNLTAPLVVAKAAVPSMIERGGGSIINIGSLVALQAQPSLAAYASAKNGVIALTRTMAKEWGPHRVRANTVVPGLVRTAAWDHYENEDDIQGLTGQEIPLGRWATPQDIADPVVFFASDASSFITGTDLLIDGGQLA